MEAGIDMRKEFDRIISSNQPDIEKLSQAFRYLIERHIEIARREVELLKAMEDREGLVKEQVKMNAMAYSLSLYNDCYRQVMRRKASNE